MRSTAACWILNGSARAVSLRVQPLSGSRTPPSPRRGGGPQPYGSATLGSKPWPAPSAITLHAVTGITNKSLRALMTGLLGAPYSMTQASYDLTRLRRNGLITRIPHRNTYQLTADGLAFAIFYTKVHNRVLGRSRRRPPPSTTTATRRATHHRPAHRRPTGSSPTTVAGRLKLWTSAKPLATKDR